VAAAWSFCYHIVTRDCAEVASSSDELLLLLLLLVVVLVLVLAGGRLLGRFVGRCRSPVMATLYVIFITPIKPLRSSVTGHLSPAPSGTQYLPTIPRPRENICFPLQLVFRVIEFRLTLGYNYRVRARTIKAVG